MRTSALTASPFLKPPAPGGSKQPLKFGVKWRVAEEPLKEALERISQMEEAPINHTPDLTKSGADELANQYTQLAIRDTANQFGVSDKEVITVAGVVTKPDGQTVMRSASAASSLLEDLKHTHLPEIEKTLSRRFERGKLTP